MISFAWTVAFALFAVQPSGAHIHLCFDGQEPARSYHASDVTGDHHGGGESRDSHQDQDVSVVEPAAAKKSAQAGGLGPALIAALLTLLPPPDRSIARDVTTQNPEPKLPDLFLPLLRGPPV